MKFQIDFECHWNDTYPMPITCGTFYRNANNIIDILIIIHRDWLHLSSLLDYTFIISSETDCIMLSKGSCEDYMKSLTLTD